MHEYPANAIVLAALVLAACSLLPNKPTNRDIHDWDDDNIPNSDTDAIATNRGGSRAAPLTERASLRH